MKLSDYAKANNIHYKTAWRWFKTGLIKGKQFPTGTIIIDAEISNLEDLNILLNEFKDVIKTFCIRIYGQKAAKQKIEEISNILDE